ncbi:ABC transporter ATP-binding protein [Arthrobacter sp. UM1]|uniref:ABC transporter ATP-binding protein n=1 Tax=Arthrobacter sp. UM1 TaxID=2766776 RepID=UPI001CF6CFE2|nr:oligopeptide/dipeptide ABC transporter ATP-binding protein [Arthrobacter sp. UM1]
MSHPVSHPEPRPEAGLEARPEPRPEAEELCAGRSAAESGPHRDSRPEEPVLAVEDLKVHIPVKSGGKKGTVKAVDGVSFELRRGRTLGIVGESGCGKSTTAKAVMRLVQPTGGRVTLLGSEISSAKGRELRSLRKHVQMVFQDPHSALNPRLTVGQIIAEPMQAQGFRRAEIRERVDELLELVGLHPRHRSAFAHQFSGGQRQRIGTARALATNPDVLILDEPVSALDVSVQAQVVNLFKDLQERLGIAMVFISHDLSVVRHVSDDVAVMYLGRIVEQGPAEEVLARPQHPYTQALLSAAPGRQHALESGLLGEGGPAAGPGGELEGSVGGAVGGSVGGAASGAGSHEAAHGPRRAVRGGGLAGLGERLGLHLKKPGAPVRAASARESSPQPERDANGRIMLAGDVPSPVNPPSGCRFRTRCWKATEVCKTTPQLEAPSAAGRSAAGQSAAGRLRGGAGVSESGAAGVSTPDAARGGAQAPLGGGIAPMHATAPGAAEHRVACFHPGE